MILSVIWSSAVSLARSHVLILGGGGVWERFRALLAFTNINIQRSAPKVNAKNHSFTFFECVAQNFTVSFVQHARNYNAFFNLLQNGDSPDLSDLARELRVFRGFAAVFLSVLSADRTIIVIFAKFCMTHDHPASPRYWRPCPYYL